MHFPTSGGGSASACRLVLVDQYAELIHSTTGTAAAEEALRSCACIGSALLG
jgi:hypothetical protein